MFEAGSIVWRIQTVGKDVLKQDLAQSEAAAKKAGTELGEAGKKSEEMGKKQETAAQKTRKLAQEQAEAAKKARDLASAQETVGRSMVVVGAAVAATAALTVKAAIDWETAWTGVTKTVDGTPEELGAIEDGLRDLSRVLPASHAEIAAVAEAAGQLGVQASNVVAFTKTMIDLGETTNLSANDAATALARFMNVMGTSQDEASNLGSSVVELGNNYATTEAEIVAMATRLSGAAKQIKLSEGQTLGLAAALSSVGIEAEAGGSAMSKVMIDIAASVDKGGDRVEMFAKISGLSADEFSRKWRTDPGAALAVFVKGLANAEAQGGSTLGMLEELGITEVRMRDALLRSAAASDEFSKAMETGNEAFEKDIALQIEAQKRYETTASKIELAKNAVVDTAISMGEHLLPAVEAVAGGIQGLSEFIGGLPPELQQTGAVLTLLTGGILLAGGTALLAVPKIAAFKLAVKTLATEMPRATKAAKNMAGFLTGPWGFAITLAVLLLGGFINRQNELQASTDALKASLDAQSGAVTDLTRETLASNLAQKDAFSAGERLGVTQKDLIDVILGNADAVAKYEDALRTASTGTVNQQRDALALKQAIDDQRNSLGDSRSQWEDTTKATDKNVESTQSAASAYLDAQKEVDGLTQELDQLIDTLNKANGIGQDAITKNNDYRRALADVDDQIKKAQKGTKGYAATLDSSTKAGQDNLDMLVDLAQNAWDAADAQHQLDGDTGAFKKRLEDSRETLIQRAMDLGDTREEAEKLADQILNIPSQTEWEVIAQTTDAQTALQGFITSWDGKRIKLFVDAQGGTTYTVPGTNTRFNADGAVYAYANGGMRENHVAQIARAGDIRVWAEPETGGEAYIPLSPAKRSSSVPVLAETASRMGFGLTSGGSQDRPIYMDGSLFGVLREIASGEARIVLNSELNRSYASRVSVR